MDTDELVIDALRQLGIEARLLVGAPRSGDLVVDLEGFDVELELKRRSLVTDATASQLLDEVSSGTLLVVADRVTESARELLRPARRATSICEAASRSARAPS